MITKRILKYISSTIAFQEVPDEISLVLQISGCGKTCKGCHSPMLQQDVGVELDRRELTKLIKPYADFITCVCFMGCNNRNKEALLPLLRLCKDMGFKTCLYTSYDIGSFMGLMPYLDFIKTGEYMEELGGLSSLSTNQKFFKLAPIQDLTYKFQTRKA